MFLTGTLNHGQRPSSWLLEGREAGWDTGVGRGRRSLEWFVALVASRPWSLGRGGFVILERLRIWRPCGTRGVGFPALVPILVALLPGGGLVVSRLRGNADGGGVVRGDDDGSAAPDSRLEGDQTLWLPTLPWL